MTTPRAPGVYAPRLYRCNINASLPGGEIMVNTVWMQRDASTLAGVTIQMISDKVRDSWAKLVTQGPGGVGVGLATFVGTDVVWTSVTSYEVDAAGRAVAQAESTFAATVKGSGGSMLPPQLAICCTLLTETPGRRGRGRLFLGGISAGLLTAQGRLTVANRDGIATRLAAFYKEVRDAPFQNDYARPVVVSPTTGTAAPITRVQVGDVPDTMRSRRNKLIEARFTVAVG